MRVEQGKKGFAPITIILENKEEADALWYALAVDDCETREDYLKQRDELEEKGKNAKICSYIEDMRTTYDNVYCVDDY